MRRHNFKLSKIGIYPLLIGLLLINNILIISISIYLSQSGAHNAFVIYREQRQKTVVSLLESVIKNSIQEVDNDEQLKDYIEKAAYVGGVFVRFTDMNNNVVIDTINVGSSVDGELIDYEKKIYRDKKYLGTLSLMGNNIEGIEPDKAYIFYNANNKTLLLILIAGSIISLISVILLVRSVAWPLHKMRKKTEQIKFLKKNKINISSYIYEIMCIEDNFNFMIEMIKEKEKWRQNLLDDLSHELRTPFSIISMQLEGILDGVTEISIERLIIINQEVSRLVRLTTDMQELSISQGVKFELKYEKHDIYFIVKKIVDKFNSAFQDRNITILYDYPFKPSSIYCDGDKLTQAIFNLISNAVKYSYDNGTIEVKVSTVGDNYRISVKDYGIGIPEDCVPYLFERFYRVDPSRTINTKGSGLGLCIAKALVEAHEGSIIVKSTYRRGSTFMITIPCHKTAGGA